MKYGDSLSGLQIRPEGSPLLIGKERVMDNHLVIIEMELEGRINELEHVLKELKTRLEIVKRERRKHERLN